MNYELWGLFLGVFVVSGVLAWRSVVREEETRRKRKKLFGVINLPRFPHPREASRPR
jgi:hypothetical protein